MIDTTGYLNDKHRIWSFDNIKPCSTCIIKNKNDTILEMFLRFKIHHLLKIENDNFTQKFRNYKGIEFIFKIPHNNNNNIINYIIEQKLILGVGFRNKNLFNENINFQTSFHFIIPILAFGKMWEIIFNEIKKLKKNIIIVDEILWNSFKYKSISALCLICNNFPLGIYPGNFIVNQNILYMRGFIWMGKKRFHVQKSTRQIIAYNDNSVIITWPFLKDHIKLKSVNHLGNMACFTSGDIFSNYIDAIIKKIYKIFLQNDFVVKIKYNPSKISIEDLKLMYKYCRRKKSYCVKTFQKLTSNIINDEQENCIISAINNNNINNISPLLSWFKYPKSKTNLAIIIQEMSQMIKRGEIDSAITQTSILSKDYNIGDNNNNILNKINLDVHRIGRFTRNVATNDFWNICSIGCGVQKVLPKDTKTKEPKKITKSEIGFLDLINTPDTPRHCGLIVESVLDVIISTHSMLCPSLEAAFTTLYPNNFHRIDNNVTTLESPYIYVCANLELFRFKPSIPTADYLNHEHYIYLAKQYGIENYFRMIQYALKIKYPCIELVKESNQFWICTSEPRMFYKIHTDGLLYTSREMEYFEKDIFTSSLWIGADMRNRILNIFGPSVRGTPRPNTCHLPRISHACSSSWKHAVGIPSNTGQQTAAIHQKNVTISYYCLKLDPSDNIILPGFSCLVLVMSGFNNQEDGIAVRKSVIERGMFLANSYEIATVRINYSIFQTSNIKFIPTIKKNQILRKGIQIGYFRNKTEEEEEEEEERLEEEEEEEEEKTDIKFSKDKLIDVFSSELKLLRCDLTTGGIGLPLDNNNNNKNDNILEKNECLAVIWLGKNNNDIIKCYDIKCHDIKCMKNLKLYLIYSSQFTPTVGDKLQTSTSQKGVITQLLNDEDTPFIVTKNGENLLPEIIINPQYLKRQTFDNIFHTGKMLSKDDNNPYLENCFNYEIGNSIYHMQLGSKELTGKVINPITGYPYMKPTNNSKILYKKPFYEYLGEDGFTYVVNKNSDYDDNYEIIEGSIYIGHYFNVCNHRATHMMQSSKCDDNIIRTEFSGTPIRGKRGGFSTGPQEQLALTGMGMTRFNREVSLLRSDYCTVSMKSKEGQNEEIFGGSTTFKRMHDDLDMRGLNVTYKIKKLGE